MIRTLNRLPVRLLRLAAFVVFFLGQLVVANVRVAFHVLTPHTSMRVAILAVPVRARTDLELTLLGNLISLTPGTLTLEVAEDRSALYVHSLLVTSPEAFRDGIARFEDRLLGVLR